MREWNKFVKNSKPGWEILLETQIRNLRQHAKMVKQRKNTGTCWRKKGMCNTRKKDTKARGKTPESTGERRRIKKILKQVRTMQAKQDTPKKKKKENFTNKNACKQSDAREAKQFWRIIWQLREHYKKSPMISNMAKKLAKDSKKDWKRK